MFVDYGFDFVVNNLIVYKEKKDKDAIKGVKFKYQAANLSFNESILFIVYWMRTQPQQSCIQELTWKEKIKIAKEQKEDLKKCYESNEQCS